MLSVIFPEQFDNTFRGKKLGLWLFFPLVLVGLSMGLSAIFDGEGMAGSADGVALEAFSPAGVQALISVLALVGLLQLLIGLVCLMAFLRYRAMIPFLYVVLLSEFGGRKLILKLLPIARTGADTPFSELSFILPAVMIIGLALSVWVRKVD